MTNRPLLIAGNWKMNSTKQSATALLSAIVRQYTPTQGIKVVVFPPNLYIPLAEQMLSGTGVAWGAQNMSSEDDGAYTGETSSTMLEDFACQYVIIGHSERRSLFAEDNDCIAKKIIKSKQAAITPILCVGETAQQRRANQTMDIIKSQLMAVLSQSQGVELLHNSVIAYEPIWAIGTGETATPEQAQLVHQQIRALVAEYSSQIADELPILYGGSLKAANADNLLRMPDIDGGLIGGASLKEEEFLKIIQIASRIVWNQ